MENPAEITLNPSFVIPALYCSVILNIILIFIILKILGPLRRLLKKLGDDSTLILNSNEVGSLIEVETTESNKQNIDKNEDLF